VPWSEIASIEYASPELGAALAALTGGKVADAVAQLDVLLKTEKLRPALRQEALFHTGVAHLRDANDESALEAFRTFVESFPNGRYVRPSADHVVFALLARDDIAGAAGFLDKLAADTSAVPALQPDIAVLRGRVFEAQKKPDEALAQYALGEKGGASPTALSECKLGRARVLLATAKASEAESIFRQLTTEDLPGSVLSGAWNGVGDILSEEGKRKREGEKILDALYAYLRGVVLYKPIDGEARVEYEHSLAGSERCFRYISEIETNPERKKVYAERSREKLNQLRREFPSSPYLPK
jgi:hypothetical protein